MRKIELSEKLQREIVDFLTSLPTIHDHDSQQALIYNAGLDAQLQRKIDFSGPSGQFFQLLIPILRSYGKLADNRDPLEAVLEAAKGYVGIDRQAECVRLIEELHKYSPYQQEHSAPPQLPHQTSQIWNLLKNIVLGMSVFTIVLWFQHIGWLNFTQYALMDVLTKIFQDNPPKATHPLPSLIFCDIDNETWKTWGEPKFLRERLFQLIQTAVKGNASVIIVDAILDQKKPTVEQVNIQTLLPDDPDDLKLYNYLAKYSQTCRSQCKADRCPHLLLLRNFVEQANCPQIGISFLDKVVAASADDMIHWGTAGPLSQNHPIIHHIDLWLTPCDSNLEPNVMDSLQLWTVKLLLKEQNIKQNDNYVPPKLPKPSIPKDCLSCPVPPQQRILYRISPTDIHVKTKTLTYNRYSAGSFKPVSELEGAVVIIGASYDANDLHRTPIGQLPGSLVILNAIYSLWRYGVFPVLSVKIKLLIVFTLITGMTVALPRWRNKLCGILLTGLIFFCSLLLILFWFYGQRYWVELDLFLPLCAVQLRQLASAWRKVV